MDDSRLFKRSFYQWVNVEYGIIKKQYKLLNKLDKIRLKSEYKISSDSCK